MPRFRRAGCGKPARILFWFYNKCWGQVKSPTPTFIIEPKKGGNPYRIPHLLNLWRKAPAVTGGFPGASRAVSAAAFLFCFPFIAAPGDFRRRFPGDHSRISGTSPPGRFWRMYSAASMGGSVTCWPVPMFFTEQRPWAISSSPSSTAKGTPSLSA